MAIDVKESKVAHLFISHIRVARSPAHVSLVDFCRRPPDAIVFFVVAREIRMVIPSVTFGSVSEVTEVFLVTPRVPYFKQLCTIVELLSIEDSMSVIVRNS